MAGTYCLTTLDDRIWICTFILAFHSTISGVLINYIQGGFKSAPQVSTSYILANIVGGVVKLPLGKTLNLWGRAEGTIVSVAVYLLGMIILASCNGPSGYAAGYTLYWIGYYCLYLILNVFVADTSGLRNRAFAFGFMQTPFICTAFTGSLAANSIYTKYGWRWGYGIFCIVTPFVFLPLAMVFKYFENKAKKQGLLRRQPSGRTTMQSIIHYIHEFDGKSPKQITITSVTNKYQLSVPSCLWLPGFFSSYPSVWLRMVAPHTKVQHLSLLSLSVSRCSLSSPHGRNGAHELTSSDMN